MIGLRLLSGFFAFGATMCALTVFLLRVPGTPLDAAWRLNPEAQRSFHSLGPIAALLMLVVGTACALASIGLWRGRTWGIRLAVMILSVNICGDLWNALGRHDYRSLIGIPIGAIMIAYLLSQSRRCRIQQ